MLTLGIIGWLIVGLLTALYLRREGPMEVAFWIFIILMGPVALVAFLLFFLVKIEL